jgi:hypothetical protein
MPVDAAAKSLREARRFLSGLTVTVEAFLAQHDAAMQIPDARLRGQRIGHLCSALETASHSARRYGLGKKGLPSRREVAAATVAMENLIRFLDENRELLRQAPG